MCFLNFKIDTHRRMPIPIRNKFPEVNILTNSSFKLFMITQGISFSISEAPFPCVFITTNKKQQQRGIYKIYLPPRLENNEAHIKSTIQNHNLSHSCKIVLKEGYVFLERKYICNYITHVYHLLDKIVAIINY